MSVSENPDQLAFTSIYQGEPWENEVLKQTRELDFSWFFYTLW